MTALRAEKAQKFIDWFIKNEDNLSPNTSIDEAKELYLKKLENEENESESEKEK